ncbi:MAG: amidohydrolase [Acidobacteria bacterium]|nr:amidohydrolase [Acidobacteriota bacterium]
MKRILIFVLLILGLAALEAPGARAQGDSVTVIQNATILTVTRGTIENGSILIRNGRIAAVGKNVRVPQGATVIDATGQYVSPGIIDAHSHIAVDGGVNEGSIAVSSMVGIEEVLDPDDINLYRDLAGGVTTANVLHGSANPIGGKNAVIKLRWGKDAKGLLFEGAKPGIKFALGENPKRSNFTPPPGVPRRYPATRMGVMDVIRQAFTEAREYRKQWQQYRERVAAGKKNVLAPRRDLKLDTLVEILEGQRLVHAHCYRADEILQLIRLAEEFGFKITTFQHVLEGYKVAKEIAAHGAGASTFSDWWAYKVEAYDATPYNAALMTQKGVVVSINSDSAEEARHLNQEAAKTMKFGGLSETEALKLVTLNPAIQLQIADRVGSIEVGKDADLVIYDKHPLSVYSVPQMVLIDGLVYFDLKLDILQRAEIEKEKKALQEKEKKKDEKKEEKKEEKKPEEKKPETKPASGAASREEETR